MPRPKKVQEIDITPVGVETMPVAPNQPAPPTNTYIVKDCPKCRQPAKGPYKDKNGNFRCHCSACNYWETVVRLTAKDSAKAWNECGGPTPLF